MGRTYESDLNTLDYALATETLTYKSQAMMWCACITYTYPYGTETWISTQVYKQTNNNGLLSGADEEQSDSSEHSNSERV